jgi:hypothetical protein
MKLANASNTNRKFGKPRAPLCAPPKRNCARAYRQFVASAAPVARSRLAGAVSAGSAADFG